ncbi:ankyrin repeat domain-containing protein [Mangrovimicrobium sediminis]|uniref:Ankyrin repeat domain-containing protein n=1 Tax=Mangrovimicrobium sediminis TaxID=2562682 RepID=A0A4Z0LTF9_9GAMM|nr:ankyrin repeat domain-containing protein [Haliea sp. SAOS-164]TGD70673.1 ankyrin repeat domain-containing protein [Haliea sp. SAOS-164]
MQELNRAIFEENLSEINRILNAGVDIDAVDSTGKTALMQAVEQENIRFVELLIHHGASVNCPGNDGWAPIHLAVDVSIDGTVQSNGVPHSAPTSIIGYLIGKGADLHQETDSGETAYTIARKYENKKITEYLNSAKP